MRRERQEHLQADRKVLRVHKDLQVHLVQQVLSVLKDFKVQ